MGKVEAYERETANAFPGRGERERSISIDWRAIALALSGLRVLQLFSEDSRVPRTKRSKATRCPLGSVYRGRDSALPIH